MPRKKLDILFNNDSLKRSVNPVIEELVEKNFVASEPRAISYLDTTELRQDLVRRLRLNSKVIADRNGYIYLDDKGRPLEIIYDKKNPLHVSSAIVKKSREAKQILRKDSDVYLNDEELVNLLNLEFPSEVDGFPIAELLLQYYSQGISYYSMNAAVEACRSSNENFVLQEVSADSRSNISYNAMTKKTSFKHDFPRLNIIESSTGRSLIIPGGQWIYKLKSNGFIFKKAVIYSEDLQKMYLTGKSPARLDDFASFAGNTMLFSIRSAFHAIFNPEASTFSSDVAAFFGYTRRANRYLKVYEAVELVFFPFTIVKNSLKLFTEFLPLVIEKLADTAMLKLDRKIHNRYWKKAAIFLPTVIFGIARSFRELGRRLTSPVTSFKSAYATGAETHPIVGVIAAGISALMSLGLMVATGYAGAMIVSALGFTAAGAAAAYLINHTAALGSLLTAGIVDIATSIGVTLSTASISLIASSFIGATIALGVISLREGFKQLLNRISVSKVDTQTQTLTPEPALITPTSTVMATNKLSTTSTKNTAMILASMQREGAIDDHFIPLSQDDDENQATNPLFRRLTATIESENKTEPAVDNSIVSKFKSSK